MRYRIIVCLIAAAVLAVLPAAGQPKAGPKVYISVDMEGIWGVVHGDQTSAAGEGYGPARRRMAEDVNAVIKGLREAGAGGSSSTTPTAG